MLHRFLRLRALLALTLAGCGAGQASTLLDAPTPPHRGVEVSWYLKDASGAQVFVALVGTTDADGRVVQGEAYELRGCRSIDDGLRLLGTSGFASRELDFSSLAAYGYGSHPYLPCAPSVPASIPLDAEMDVDGTVTPAVTYLRSGSDGVFYSIEDSKGCNDLEAAFGLSGRDLTAASAPASLRVEHRILCGTGYVPFAMSAPTTSWTLFEADSVPVDGELASFWVAALAAADGGRTYDAVLPVFRVSGHKASELLGGDDTALTPDQAVAGLRALFGRAADTGPLPSLPPELRQRLGELPFVDLCLAAPCAAPKHVVYDTATKVTRDVATTRLAPAVVPAGAPTAVWPFADKATAALTACRVPDLEAALGLARPPAPTGTVAQLQQDWLARVDRALTPPKDQTLRAIPCAQRPSDVCLRQVRSEADLAPSRLFAATGCEGRHELHVELAADVTVTKAPLTIPSGSPFDSVLVVGTTLKDPDDATGTATTHQATLTFAVDCAGSAWSGCASATAAAPASVALVAVAAGAPRVTLSDLVLRAGPPRPTVRQVGLSAADGTFVALRRVRIDQGVDAGHTLFATGLDAAGAEVHAVDSAVAAAEVGVVAYKSNVLVLGTVADRSTVLVDVTRTPPATYSAGFSLGRDSVLRLHQQTTTLRRGDRRSAGIEMIAGTRAVATQVKLVNTDLVQPSEADAVRIYTGGTGAAARAEVSRHFLIQGFAYAVGFVADAPGAAKLFQGDLVGATDVAFRRDPSTQTVDQTLVIRRTQ